MLVAEDLGPSTLGTKRRLWESHKNRHGIGEVPVFIEKLFFAGHDHLMDECGPASPSSLLLRNVALSLALDPASTAAVETRLFENISTSRAAWPALPLSDDELLRYLAERLSENEDPLRALENVNAADLYLAAACALEKPRALEAFEHHCLDDLDVVLVRFSKSSVFHDEVRQAVRERLFMCQPNSRARIADYAGRGSLKSWVRVMAVRLAVDLLRKRGQEPHTAEETELENLAIDADSELRFLAERYRDEVKAAFRNAFAALSAAERNLLRLHYLEGLTLDQVAAMKRVHRATIARQIARCREEVAVRTHQFLVERLGISPSQVDSVMRLVRSHLDLSIDRWLGNGPRPR